MTRPESAGSVVCDWCADDAPVYVQATVTRDGVTREFDHEFRSGIMLGSDHKLYLKQSVWLNEMGEIHMETTYMLAVSFVSRGGR
jgi:hypothetical protein